MYTLIAWLLIALFAIALFAIGDLLVAPIVDEFMSQTTQYLIIGIGICVAIVVNRDTR
jgi:hypothetical protein